MARIKIGCLFLLFFCGLGFAQVQEIYDYELTPAVVGVRADNGPKRMYAEVITIDIYHEGYYQIIPKILYNSGDEQKNESFYLTVRDQFDTVHTPVDSNAGPYKIILDDPGPPHTAWRLGGRFYLYPGPNTIEMHHFAKIMDEYPQFLNGPIGGPESIRIVDSLRVIAEPLVDADVQVRSFPARYRMVNDRLEGLVYPGESVPYRIAVHNRSANLLRFSSLKNQIPDYVTASNFSLQPDSVVNSIAYWQLGQIEPLDSLVIIFDGNVGPAPSGLSLLVDHAELTVANDADSTNNYDSDSLYVFADDQGTRPDSADIALRLESVTDSLSITHGDTLKWSRPDSNYTYNFWIVNNGPDYSDSLMLAHAPPEHVTPSTFSVDPDSVITDSLYWFLEPLAPGDTVFINYLAHVQTPPVLTENDTLLHASANIHTRRDPNVTNNSDVDTVYVDLSGLPIEPKSTDLLITHRAVSDSLVERNGEMIPAVFPDQEFVYEITVHNTGSNSAQEVNVYQILPQYVTFLGTSQPATVTNDTLFWSLGTILPGQQRLLTVDAKLFDSIPKAVDLLESNAQLSALNDSDSLNNRDTALLGVLLPTFPKEADVSITYTATSDSLITISGMDQTAALPGSIIDYSLLVNNSGPDAANQAVISVALPTNVTTVQFSVAPSRQTADSLFWDIGTLTPNSPVDLSFQVKVAKSYAFYPYPLQSSAEIFAHPDNDPANNSAQTTVYVLAPPLQYDLSLNLHSVTDSVLSIQGEPFSGAVPGEEFYYELFIRNQSTEKAENIRVSLYLPGYIGFFASDITPIMTGQDSVVWLLDELPAGQSAMIRVNANLNVNIPSLIIDRTSMARVFIADDPNPNDNMDSDRIIVLRDNGENEPADLAVTFSADADSQITVGGQAYAATLTEEEINYHLRILNNGPGTCYDIVVVNVIPDSISITDFALPPAMQRQDSLFWEFDSLVSGGLLQLDYIGTAAENFPLYPYLLPNTVKLVSKNDPDLANNQADAPAYVLARGTGGSDFTDLAVNLSSMTDTSVVVDGMIRNAVKPGQTFVFSIDLENLGIHPSETIRLIQTLPDYLTFLGASLPPQMNGNTLTWDLDALANGASRKIFVNAKLEKALPVSMNEFSSQVNLFTQNDINPENNSDEETLEILTSGSSLISDAGISYSVVADSQVTLNGTIYKASKAGKTVTYPLRIVNLGPDKASDIRVYHVLPDSFSSFSFTVEPQSIEGDTLIWNISELMQGSSATLDFTATLVRSFTHYPYLLEGSAWLELANDPNPDNDRGQTRLYVLEPDIVNYTDLSVELEALTDSTIEENGTLYPAVVPGEMFDYELTIRNLGPRKAHNIQIEQTLFPELEFLSSTFAPTGRQKDRLNWVLDSLDLDEETSWKIRVKVNKPILSPVDEIFSSSVLSAVQDTNSSNNVSATTVKLLQPLHVDPLDLAIELRAMTKSTRIIEGDTVKSLVAGDSLLFTVLVFNRGPAIARQTRVGVVLPDSLTALHFSPGFISGDTLIWEFSDLDRDSVWVTSFQTVLTPQLPHEPFELETLAQVKSDQDTTSANNNDSEIVYGFFGPDLLPDVIIELNAHTDSVYFDGSDSLKYVNPDEMFSYTLVARNTGPYESRNTTVALSLPDSLELISVTPGASYTATDSIVWQLGTLAAFETQFLTIECELAPEMPIGENTLWATAWISADNEPSGSLWNNRAQTLVTSVVRQTEPVVPDIKVSQPVVDVRDSIFVSVWVPSRVTEWDLWLYLPDGQIIKDFADEFISATDLPAGEWVRVDTPYLPGQLITKDDQEELIFEIHVIDYNDNERSDRASVIVVSSDQMLLDRNVYRPDLDAPLGIRFKLARYRKARLDIYDVAGRHITMLVDDYFDGGWHQYDFDGFTSSGKLLGSGVYLVTLQAGEYKSWKKFIVVR